MTLVLLLATPPVAGTQTLAATEAGTSTMTGALDVPKTLAAAPAGSSTMTGAVLIDRFMLGTAMIGTGTMTGALTMADALAGTMAGSATLTGALFVGLSGQMAASSAMTAGLTVSYALVGQAVGDSILGDGVVPDPALYPSPDLYPGAGSADMPIVFALGATSASSSTMTGGYSDLAGVMAGSSQMGAWQLPATTQLPATSLLPGTKTADLQVGQIKQLATTDAGSSSMSGLLLASGATAGPVDIVITIAQTANVTVSFGDPLVGVSNQPQILIGVSDG